MFRPLFDVYSDILRSIPNGSCVTETSELILKPSSELSSERNSCTRPDGYFLITDGTDPLPWKETATPSSRSTGSGNHDQDSFKSLENWYDIGPTLEFKRNASPEVRNDVSFSVT